MLLVLKIKYKNEMEIGIIIIQCKICICVALKSSTHRKYFVEKQGQQMDNVWDNYYNSFILLFNVTFL